MKPAKFVQISTVREEHSEYATVYALDSTGRVWWLNDDGWHILTDKRDPESLDE